MRILILFLVFHYSCNSKIKKTNIKEPMFYIEFQDFFDKDKVSLFLNDCMIFKNKELTSLQSIGFTGMHLKVYKSNKGYTFYIRGSKNKTCEIQQDSLILKVVINGEENVFTLNLKKGKYIGFDRKGRYEITFNQSVIPFEYE